MSRRQWRLHTFISWHSHVYVIIFQSGSRIPRIQNGLPEADMQAYITSFMLTVWFRLPGPFHRRRLQRAAEEGQTGGRAGGEWGEGGEGLVVGHAAMRPCAV